ncbi:MAG: hypothetical protein L6V81_06000 [Clostridium sp.]|nr:MAG: hypothetical protein L6V81_06000 [Clostridium sp.]
MTMLNDINFALKLVIVFVITYLIFKDEYNRLKSYYKIHLHDINLKVTILFKKFRNINSTLHCTSCINKKFRASSRNV